MNSLRQKKQVVPVLRSSGDNHDSFEQPTSVDYRQMDKCMGLEGIGE